MSIILRSSSVASVWNEGSGLGCQSSMNDAVSDELSNFSFLTPLGDDRALPICWRAFFFRWFRLTGVLVGDAFIWARSHSTFLANTEPVIVLLGCADPAILGVLELLAAKGMDEEGVFNSNDISELDSVVAVNDLEAIC